MRRFCPSRLCKLWGVAATLLAAACFASSWWYTRGRFLAPLDDVYIILAYARQLALGEPFRFNHGDPASTGATSMLYTVILSPLAVVGGRHEAVLLAGVIALNAALLWWSCRSAWLIAIRIMEPWLAGAAVLALLASGPIIWAFFCGLDTGLMTALTLALIEVWPTALEERGRRWWHYPAVVSAALAFTRPEGACLVLAGGLTFWWICRSEGRVERGRISALIGTGAFAIAMLPPMVITGSALPSSSWAKTAWASPIIPATVALADSARFAVDAVKGIWMGGYPSEATVGWAGGAQAGNEVIYCFPPAALLLFLVGCVPLAGRGRNAVVLGAVLWAVHFAAVSLIMPVGWHHHRYLLPLFPVFTLLSFSGIARISWLFRMTWRRPFARIVVAGWLVFSAPGLLKYLMFSGAGSENYLAHHRQMASLLEELPQPGSVAATDVGILRYFTSRRIVDIKGLTAPWLAPAAMRGWGSLYDEFKSMPEEARPRFAALHPGRPDVDVEQPLRAGLLAERASLPSPRIASDFVLYAFRFAPAGGPPVINGWVVVDELDCALPSSESAHRHRMYMQSRDSVPYSTLKIMADSAQGKVVGDGGWVISGGESFEMRAHPGYPMAILMRTHAPRPSALVVSVNEARFDRVPVGMKADRFQTILIAQAGPGLVKRRNTIRVRCDWPSAREYSCYHYWILQPAASGGQPPE